jgi:hypothetical protein
MTEADLDAIGLDGRMRLPLFWSRTDCLCLDPERTVAIRICAAGKKPSHDRGRCPRPAPQLRLAQRRRVGSLDGGPPWEVAPGGWTVTSELQGWRFKVEPIPEALRLTAWPPSGSPAAWEVLPR